MRTLFIGTIFTGLMLLGSQACTVQYLPESSLNYEIEINNEKLLLGRINRDAFQLPEYEPWFRRGYYAYTPNEKLVPAIQEKLKGVSIKAFIGTWCSDSQREIPALLHILDKAEYNADNLSLIAVDRSKTLPDQAVKDHSIDYVPTIIFYRGKQELGRIIEYPEQTLEEDILKYISQ